VLNGDDGNYLLPVKPDTGYAEVALCEPWACVEASYTVDYRTNWQAGGVVWLVGDGAGVQLGLAETWGPRKVVLGVTDAAFAGRVRAWAAAHGIEVSDADDGATPYDDIVVLGGDAALCEQAFGRLANGGVFNVVQGQPFDRPVAVDIGRMHYDHLSVVGTTTADLSAAYQPVRTQLQAMGQMHLMRALSLPGKPGKIVATDLFSARMEAVKRRFSNQAAAAGVELVLISRDELDSDATFLGREQEEGGAHGYDDIVVLAPFASVVEQAWPFAGDNCVINVFAGLSRGTIARIDLNAVAGRGVRYTGTSGSSIDDLRRMRDLVESRQLPTNHSVYAIAGLEGVADGLHAVAEGRFAGKVVVYPNLNKPLPVTPLTELDKVLPSVAARLDENGMWTQAAEEELLRVML
jgi:hypothetical protein